VVAELGWDPLVIDQFVENFPGSARTGAYAGSFDEKAIATALGDPVDGAWILGNPHQKHEGRTAPVLAPQLVKPPLSLTASTPDPSNCTATH
jgi:hypothetical protein